MATPPKKKSRKTPAKADKAAVKATITTKPVRTSTKVAATAAKVSAATTTRPAVTAAAATVLRARASSDDAGFSRVLQARAADPVLGAAVERFEDGRRRWAAEAEAATAAELELLEAERRRLKADAPNDAARLARIQRTIAAVTTDLGGLRDLRGAMERAVPPVAGGFTVVGRVLSAEGGVPQKAEVALLGPDDQDIGLAALAVGADGMVRESYPPEIVRKLEAGGTQVVAVVRIGRRVVARDETPVRVRAGVLHQFDLRVGTLG
jgi:hypothetical protein